MTARQFATCTGYPDCMMCSGAACNLCGAGCWSNVKDCQHDVVERHEEPTERTGYVQESRK